jgi:hypothetical protein
MGFCSIPEKEAAGWPLWPDYGHYMGLNFDVFLRIKRYNGPDLYPVESDGYTGVFWGESCYNISCESDAASLRPEVPGHLIRPSIEGVQARKNTFL